MAFLSTPRGTARQKWCARIMVIFLSVYDFYPTWSIKMVTDDLVTRGARASAVIVLSYFPWNIPVSVPERLSFEDIDFQWVRKCIFAYRWLATYTTDSLCLVHYNDVIMDSMASQITSLTIVYSAIYSGADQRKHQSSASLALNGQ